MREMTLEQKMTLKAILENRDYKIMQLEFNGYDISSPAIIIEIYGKDSAFIQSDGRITRQQDIEVEL